MTQTYDLTGNTLKADGFTATGSNQTASLKVTSTFTAPQAVNNVNDTTPTKAELTTSAGGTIPAAGTIFTVNDAAGDAHIYLVASTGTNLFWTLMTKST